MIIKRILLFLSLLLGISATPVFSQPATLRGKVVDSESGNPLGGANIILSSTDTSIPTLGSSSQLNGEYEIKDIRTGSYELSVSFIGYDEFVIKNLTLSSGETRTLDVSLTPRVLEIGQIEVTARRRSIERLEPTSSVSILDTTQIQSRQPLSPADHLIGISGVDVAKTGITQSQVALRGFNDIFSGSLLLMVDNRIGRVPSLRFNAYGFIPTSNEDIERIEIIRGPASSLYGPNSANGVLHIITKSPLGSEGTTINFSVGQRSIFTADFRYAASFNNRIGYKITGSYIQGTDFESHDAFEDSVHARLIEADRFYRERGLPNPNPLDENSKRIGTRDFLTEKLSGTARFDYRIRKDLVFIANGGFNRAKNMELTKIGSAAVDHWRYTYGQAKLIYKNLFMQGFVNASDAGDTYLTRDGNDIEDKSKFFSYQIQNTTPFGNSQVFTYGLDAFWTRPVTNGTVNGVNEDDDDINELGFYLQSESDLSKKLKLVVAGRIDHHSRLKDPFVSPRLGLVFTSDPGNKFRISFNQAFSTPTAENLFLDRLVSPMIPGRLISFSSFAPFQPFNVRVRGVPETGFTFGRDSGTGVDGLYMQPVPLYIPPPQNGALIPADATLMWDEVLTIITQIEGSGLDFFLNRLKDVPAPTSEEVSSVLRAFNPATGEFESIDPKTVTSIKSIGSTKTAAFELGYKGVLGGKLLLNLDLYYNRIKDFIGPLSLETPNVFFDRASLTGYLMQQDSLVSTDAYNTVAQTLARMISQIPVGTVVPNESIYPGDLMLTYRNFGDIDLFGFDLDFNYVASENLNVTGAYSFVSKDIFENVDGVRDIALNAPKNKFSLGLQHKNRKSGIGWGLRFRYVEGFPVDSGVFIGKVDSFGILDFNAGVNLPGESGIRIALTVQNVLNNRHKEFVGAPEIGRLALLQFKYFPDKYRD
jgi:iron complex outermembrane receptor protein